MSRDEQIEEMANIIRCRAEQLPRCPHTTCSICKATELYNNGYRKASDVEKYRNAYHLMRKRSYEHQKEAEQLDDEVTQLKEECLLRSKHEGELIKKLDNCRGEVAREIIEILKSAGINEGRYPVIAELKQKYTEDGNDRRE